MTKLSLFEVNKTSMKRGAYDIAHGTHNLHGRQLLAYQSLTYGDHLLAPLVLQKTKNIYITKTMHIKQNYNEPCKYGHEYDWRFLIYGYLIPYI